MTIRLFRDPAATEGAAAPLPPTLAELFDRSEPVEESTTIIPPVEAGDGTPKPADLEAAATAAAQAKAAADAAAETDPEPEEPKEQEPASENPADFFSVVDTITGEPVTVDYGEVDPLTPEGIALYTAAVRKDEVTKFETYVRQSNPRAYAYFLHTQAGGDDESFMATKTLTLPSQADFENSVDIQTSVYKKALLSRGVDEDIVDQVIAKSVRDNSLLAKATAEYNNAKTTQANQLKEVELRAEQKRVALEESCNQVLGAINQTVDSGEMKFIVPETKKAGFKEFVRDALREENGKFYAVQEVGKDLKNVLESLYFNYIKGDLTSLVEKRAATKAVQRLKVGVQNAKGSAVKGSEASKAPATYVSLGDI